LILGHRVGLALNQLRFMTRAGRSDGHRRRCHIIVNQDPERVRTRSGGELGDQVLYAEPCIRQRIGVKDKGIGPCPACQLIRDCTTVADVVTRSAEQDVIAAKAQKACTGTIDHDKHVRLGRSSRIE